MPVLLIHPLSSRRADSLFTPRLGAECIPSEYATANQVFYRPQHEYRTASGDYPCLEGVTYDGERHLLPLFDLTALDNATLHRLLNGHDCFYPIAGEIALALQDRGFRIDYRDADSDYVYQADKFKEYRGRALHAKRNLLHQFEADCAPQSHDLSGAESAAQAILTGWLDDVGKSTTGSDYAPCLQAIAQHGALGLIGRITFTGAGEPAGFVIASRLGADCAVVHFAKGRRALNGVYPFLFSDLVRHHPDCRWLNFEQDLGKPGFRQNKRSFDPHHLIAKYRVRAWR